MFHNDSKYKCRQVLVSAAILLHLLFTIILARQRVDQNTEDWENQELVIICFLSVFGDMEQKYPWLTLVNL